jgi:uncharacterized cupin superfamily protein
MSDASRPGATRASARSTARRRACPSCARQPHQIINTSDRDLVYIALSTFEPTDVFLYPDSDKYGVWHGRGPNAPENFVVFGRRATGVEYWDGEADRTE